MMIALCAHKGEEGGGRWERNAYESRVEFAICAPGVCVKKNKKETNKVASSFRVIILADFCGQDGTKGEISASNNEMSSGKKDILHGAL